MLVPVKCIALRTIRLNDSKNLLSAWVESHGRLTFAITAGKSREAARRRALTTPLATFEAIADIRPGRAINTLRDISPMPGSLALASTPLQNAVAAFVAEALDNILRNSPPDNALSAYIFSAAHTFAKAHGRTLANFNISFLYHLTHMCGVGPDISLYHKGCIFDIPQATFSSSLPLHNNFIRPDKAHFVTILHRIPLDRCGLIKIDRQQRREIFDHILSFYSYHLIAIDNLESLKILQQLFE